MSSSSDLPSLRPLAGKQRKRSDAEHVNATKAAAQAARKSATPAEIQAEIEAATFNQHQQHLASTPFRFLDLPLELQEIIYSFYGASTERQVLSNLRIPALAQANREIRREFLQTFFKETSFHIYVGPFIEPRPYFPPDATYDHDYLYQAIQAAAEPDDPVYLCPHMVAAIDSDMVFKNVTFSLHQFQSLQGLQFAQWKKRVYQQTYPLRSTELKVLSLQCLNSKINVYPHSIESRHFPSIRRETFSFAKKIADREEFKGFTLEDLRKIAVKMVAGFGEVQGGSKVYD